MTKKYIKNFKDLSLSEQLLLESLKLTAICPNCGRAVLITPKDLYWVFGMTLVKEDGTKEIKPGGWRSDCKCGHSIPIDIIMKVKK